MAADDLRRRAAFVIEYRWGLAFAVAIAMTFGLVPLRPPHAPLVYDLIPLVGLLAAWVGAGLVLGVLGRHWAARASSAVLPVARTER